MAGSKFTEMDIASRETGRLRPFSFESHVKRRRISSLHLSNHKEILSAHRGSINSLEVDLTEGRYLLSGASDASIAVYDVQSATDVDKDNFIAKHSCIFSVGKQHEHGHKFCVSSAIWYPIDTGLFITGSYDNLVKVWDTNTTQVVMDFKMPDKVCRVAMSPFASSHTLIATGTEDVHVRLCDIASGACSHTLSGHQGGVMSVEWSRSSEWILATGGVDGAIRFWDIRQAGSFLVLDQSQAQLGTRPPVLQHATTTKAQSSDRFFDTRTPNTIKKWCHVPKNRVHPGLDSRKVRATAHYGAVTGLKFTDDGMYIFSTGSDSRLKLWDIMSGCNTLLNFETVHLQAEKALQLAVVPEFGLVFVPCMSTVKAFQMWSGRTFLSLKGHYDSANTCCYNWQDQELYTGGGDRQILIWSPRIPCGEKSGLREGSPILPDEDCWSE